jgi:hypothetical protein
MAVEFFLNNSFKINTIFPQYRLMVGVIQHHIPIDKTSNFALSGDGRRLFYIDSKHKDSLVYFDISREIVTLVIDKSWSGIPYSYPILEQDGHSSTLLANHPPQFSMEKSYLLLFLREKLVAVQYHH